MTKSPFFKISILLLLTIGFALLVFNEIYPVINSLGFCITGFLFLLILVRDIILKKK